jgi:hypothetical protein
MRAIEIESWALRVLENVTSNRPSEDDLVELKSTWLPANKLARRLAAHANSVRSDFILWIIGVDEKNQTVCGANHEELANWWPQMQAEFADRIAPDMTPLNVTWKGKTVVALLFKTDRAPYVVRNPAFSVEKGESVAWEVPWRGSNATRTATRNELITLLSPRIKLPLHEVRACQLIVDKPVLTDGWRQNCKLTLDFYIVPQDRAELYIPDDQCEASVEVPQWIPKAKFEGLKLTPLAASTVETSGTSIITRGTVRLKLTAQVVIRSVGNTYQLPDARVDVRLRPVGYTQSIAFTVMLHSVEPADLNAIPAMWVFNDLSAGPQLRKLTM